MKLLALLICILLCGQALAAGFPWTYSLKAKKCVLSKKCWTKGTTAVCGISPSGDYIGFPNRCYYACVNYNAGDTWAIDHWYHPSKKCYKKWTKKCSYC